MTAIDPALIGPRTEHDFLGEREIPAGDTAGSSHSAGRR
jgi:hypothetical protein